MGPRFSGCAAALVLAVSACGSNAKTQSSSAPVAASSAPSASAPAAAPPAPPPGPPAQGSAAPAGPKSEGGDQSKPEGVVNSIIDAAKSGDDSHLSSFCDDGVSKADAKKICALKKGNKRWSRFADNWSASTISKSKVDGEKARVDVTFGKNGKRKKSVRLRKVGDKWYLAKIA